MIIPVDTAQAATAVSGEAFSAAVTPVITQIVNPIVELAFAVAVVVFAYGVFQLIWASEDGDQRTKGKYSVLFGLIGMFIMVSAWGIIRLISNTVLQFR